MSLLIGVLNPVNRWKETFTKRYVVEETKAEKGPEKQREETDRVVGRVYGMKFS